MIARTDGESWSVREYSEPDTVALRYARDFAFDDFSDQSRYLPDIRIVDRTPASAAPR